MAVVRRIVAMGGGGFPTLGVDSPLDRHLLDRTGKTRPRVAFLPTAGGENPVTIARFYDVFNRHDARASHLSFFAPHTADLRGYLLEQDLVYVGGGNTRSMLALWRAWGVDHILREAWESGILLAGRSAGMICWFERGITDSIPGPLTPMECLGWLPGTACPHYDGEAQRRPTFHRLLADGAIPDGWAADDGAALVFEDGALVEAITERDGATAYRVEMRDGAPVETPLPTRRL